MLLWIDEESPDAENLIRKLNSIFDHIGPLVHAVLVTVRGIGGSALLRLLNSFNI